MTAEILIVASPGTAWVEPVAKLARAHFEVVVVAPEQAVDTTRVALMIGAPPDLRSKVAGCPQLQWIQSTWAGIDALRDCMRPGLTITPLKGVFGQSMGEFILGWILALERNIIQRAGQKRWFPEIEQPIAGKRLGILGAGSIGSEVAARAAVFDLEITGLTASGRNRPGFANCYAPQSRMEFARGLDYLVSILPATPSTDGFVNADLLSQLARGAIFINVGRGNVVVESAVTAALEGGQLRYAVLDVFDDEPLSDSHSLWQTPGVFITSHTAAPTPDTAIPDVFAENLHHFLLGEPLPGAADPERGY